MAKAMFLMNVLDEASDGYKAREEFRVFLEGLGLQAATERKYGLTAGRWAAYLDAAFTVSDGCMSCGLCRRICPVRSIQLENGRPEWLHHYERCVTCISWCPIKAIEYGNRTQQRRRYRNPRISADELMRREPGK